MNQENSEIFSPNDLNQFPFSPSGKRIIMQLIAAYASSVTESQKKYQLLVLLKRLQHM